MQNLSTDQRVLAELTADERAHAAVYVNDEFVPAGITELGGTSLRSEQAHQIAFIDQMPRANWMHACRYLVIESGRVISVDANRPPVFGPLPAGWRLVWRAASVEDWMVLPGVLKPE